jgi:hypothetical protein
MIIHYHARLLKQLHHGSPDHDHEKSNEIKSNEMLVSEAEARNNQSHRTTCWSSTVREDACGRVGNECGSFVRAIFTSLSFLHFDSDEIDKEASSTKAMSENECNNCV